MNGVAVHCDTRTRESRGVFLILNKAHSPESFSTITRMPYHEVSETLFNVKFIEEKYPDQIEI